MKTQTEIFQLCDIVRETSFALQCYLRHGHLEKVYENGLVHRLVRQAPRFCSNTGCRCLTKTAHRSATISLTFWLGGELVVELKACKALTDEYVAQLPGYLRGCRIEHGLLVNFGSRKLEVRKYVLSEAI